jgi:hypothetical protein
VFAEQINDPGHMRLAEAALHGLDTIENAMTIYNSE